MVGIVGYGAYVPIYRIKVAEIARVWGKNGRRVEEGIGVSEKSVPEIDEDATTLAVEAARNALDYAGITPDTIGAVYVGSESHPYAVKPTASTVAEAIGATPALTAADFQFACKAGTAAMQCCMGLAASGMIENGLAVGTDTAQGQPGDALEYTAGAGAAAFIIGSKGVVAEIEATCSYTTDTPDFWRRQHAEFPSHAARFTGEPAYFRHVVNATKMLLEKTGMAADAFDYVVFHQPNAKFPLRAARMLGIDEQKLRQGLLVPHIGNTYSAASMVGLASVLDVAKPGERVLVTSFGSGAGSDSFSIRITDAIEKKRGNARSVEYYKNRKQYLDYALYTKHRKKLKSL
jgi:hydroxymethylglutaryl-CoA synthase